MSEEQCQESFKIQREVGLIFLNRLDCTRASTQEENFGTSFSLLTVTHRYMAATSKICFLESCDITFTIIN